MRRHQHVRRDQRRAVACNGSLVTALQADDPASPLLVRLYTAALESLVDALGIQATAPI